MRVRGQVAALCAAQGRGEAELAVPALVGSDMRSHIDVHMRALWELQPRMQAAAVQAKLTSNAMTVGMPAMPRAIQQLCRGN